LAVECDGDRYHPHEKLAEDLERQAVLERLGWTFVRIRGSRFFREPEAAMEPVFAKLRALQIPPTGATPAQGAIAEPAPEDLKARVIRRAAEIRARWEEHPVSGGVAMAGRARRGRNRRWQVSSLGHDPSSHDAPPSIEGTSRSSPSEDNADNPPRPTTADSATATPHPAIGESAAPRAQATAGFAAGDADRIVGANALTSTQRSSRVVRKLLRGNAVCRELSALDARFSSSRCTACGASAETAIDNNEGVVIACGSEICGRLERVEDGVLQRLADRLFASCYACSGSLRSLRGPFGNYLKCGACGTNNSWRGVSERIERDSTDRLRRT